MILTIIDNETVAKKCSRTYLKLHMAYRKQDRTFDTFAKALDRDNITDVERKAYGRLRREFKKKTGIDIKLTRDHSIESVKVRNTWSKMVSPFRDRFGEEEPEAKFIVPLWLTEIKLSPELKKLKATLVIDNTIRGG